MYHVALTNEIWVRPDDAAAIVQAVSDRRLGMPCKPSGSALADALAALAIGPSIATDARFPFVESQLVEETTDEWIGTSAGLERRCREPNPIERIVHLGWLVAVRSHHETQIREYAATHYEVPISLESAVDDLLVFEYPTGWWDGCEFEIRYYSFTLVE